MEMGGESRKEAIKNSDCPSSASDLFGILRDPKSKVVFKSPKHGDQVSSKLSTSGVEKKRPKKHFQSAFGAREKS